MTRTSNETEALCLDAARRASAARPAIAALTGAKRTRLLHDMADAIRARAEHILEANARDLDAGTDLTEALRDRLRLDDQRIEKIAHAVDLIADQSDPVGKVVDGRMLPNGIQLQKRRVPIGTILVIYESRPNVTSDAAALCLKAGNAILLKGGRESAHSNRALVEAIRIPLEDRALADAVVFVDTTDRTAIPCLVGMQGLVDLCIPRGGPGLIKAVLESATIPVVKHDAGLCHIYIDEHIAGMEQRAIEIVMNAKVQRPGVCNAVETLLVHESVAPRILPALADLFRADGVEVRADEAARAHMHGSIPATEDDWRTEYLALTISVRVVTSLEEAIEHIRTYGSQHTDAILTTSIDHANRFVAAINSANVMVNCSTRFSDGGEYGLGAEIGISTDKLHARGPMGAEDLTTYQWVLKGDWQARA